MFEFGCEVLSYIIFKPMANSNRKLWKNIFSPKVCPEDNGSTKMQQSGFYPQKIFKPVGGFSGNLIG